MGALMAQRVGGGPRRATVWITGVLIWVAVGQLPAVAAPPSPSVLVVYSNGRLLPANIEGDRGLRQAIGSAAERPVQINDEFLDLPRSGGLTYEATLRTYLHDKYAPRPPDVVIAAGDSALAFLLKYRGSLFPGVLMVHMAVSPSTLRAAAPLPANLIGVPLELDFARTIEQARRWHPQARRLVLVTGSSAYDQAWEARLRVDVRRLAPHMTAEFWVGLPRASLLQRLSTLTSDSVVFTPGYFQDGDGAVFTPREAALAIAAASGAPVYGPFNTFVGIGVVGGYVVNFEAIGRQAGETVGALLRGASPASLTLPALAPLTLAVDWRQAQRWGIAEADIPVDAVVQFRERGFFETYRSEVAIAVAVILLQTALIGGLLIERRRRRRAETVEMKQRFELAHTSRLAVAGELTGSIAHEINQPLGAILANADAAELLLESHTDQRDRLRRIVADIRRDDLRASQVIRRLRSLLAKHEVERRPFDLNEAARDVVPLLHSEAHRRGVTLDLRGTPGAVWVMGDRIQVQQVLINLVMNAMDAVKQVPEARRTVTIGLATAGGRARLTVRDRGLGIAAEHLPKLFESFFSTKRKGMGLGLSIARTLVEAHGGHIRAENSGDGGAVFTVDIPVAGPSDQAMEDTA